MFQGFEPHNVRRARRIPQVVQDPQADVIGGLADQPVDRRGFYRARRRRNRDFFHRPRRLPRFHHRKIRIVFERIRQRRGRLVRRAWRSPGDPRPVFAEFFDFQVRDGGRRDILARHFHNIRQRRDLIVAANGFQPDKPHGFDRNVRQGGGLRDAGVFGQRRIRHRQRLFPRGFGQREIRVADVITLRFPGLPIITGHRPRQRQPGFTQVGQAQIANPRGRNRIQRQPHGHVRKGGNIQGLINRFDPEKEFPIIRGLGDSKRLDAAGRQRRGRVRNLRGAHPGQLVERRVGITDVIRGGRAGHPVVPGRLPGEFQRRLVRLRDLQALNRGGRNGIRAIQQHHVRQRKTFRPIRHLQRQIQFPGGREIGERLRFRFPGRG